jgi:hypothetical protein
MVLTCYLLHSTAQHWVTIPVDRMVNMSRCGYLASILIAWQICRGPGKPHTKNTQAPFNVSIIPRYSKTDTKQDSLLEVILPRSEIARLEVLK